MVPTIFVLFFWQKSDHAHLTLYFWFVCSWKFTIQDFLVRISAEMTCQPVPRLMRMTLITWLIIMTQARWMRRMSKQGFTDMVYALNTYKGKTTYLVKWQDLPYNFSTWEDPDDPVNNQIRWVNPHFSFCFKLYHNYYSQVLNVGTFFWCSTFQEHIKKYEVFRYRNNTILHCFIYLFCFGTRIYEKKNIYLLTFGFTIIIYQVSNCLSICFCCLFRVSYEKSKKPKKAKKSKNMADVS